MKVSIPGVLNNLGRTNVYTPIIEGIVNSLDAIEESGRNDGEIKISLIRNKQLILSEGGNEKLPEIQSIHIKDNGVGFTKSNIQSFNTLYSESKINKGGKGFGRMTFLRYFRNITYTSQIQEDDHYVEKNFSFNQKQEDITESLQEKNIEKCDSSTELKLDGLFDKFLPSLDKTSETIARKLVEKLLIFFISEDYKCPQIILEDESTQERIILNDLIKENEEIQIVGKDEFTIEKDGQKENFSVKIFKLYYTGNDASNIILSAHRREVIKTPLANYISEFKDEFFDTVKGETGENIRKNYTIRTYVQGKYLDKKVSAERSQFQIPKKSNEYDLTAPISQEEIETRAVNKTKEYFQNDVESRQKKKIQKIEDYVKRSAPWYIDLLPQIDPSEIDFNATEKEIDMKFAEKKFLNEQEIKAEMGKIQTEAKNFDPENILKKIKRVNQIDLAHYVITRKHVIDLFKRALELDEDKHYPLEERMHNIIFPMGKTSVDTKYQDHNLWLIDERLSFHEYVASDKSLKKTTDRPDLVLFGHPILVRENNEISSPLFVFEFKRPQRENYKEDDDPIKQIYRYVEQIRNGGYKNEKGRNIYADSTTPVYGYLICDFTDKIKSFCKDAQLVLSADQQSYYGYHSTYQIYYEVISFDKFIKDSELRNKIFFKKLGID